jgi:hypothetical protein
MRFISIARASSAAKSQGNPTRQRRLGGALSSRARGTTIVWAVVVMVTVTVTGDEPLKESDVGEGVQVAPVGVPVQLRFMLPLNPPTGDNESV